jgi:hypothetical protein
MKVKETLSVGALLGLIVTIFEKFFTLVWFAKGMDEVALGYWIVYSIVVIVLVILKIKPEVAETISYIFMTLKSDKTPEQKCRDIEIAIIKLVSIWNLFNEKINEKKEEAKVENPMGFADSDITFTDTSLKNSNDTNVFKVKK